MTEANPPKVTILIKALNEEKRIAACLDAAVREAKSVDGDVILVDSLSTDRTVEIAMSYPIRIVQFANVADRGCGAAVQLGYQYVNPATPYLYVLDADMVMEAGFLEKALAVLESDPELAGVGGKLLDSRVLNSYDRRRAHDAGRFSRSSIVDALGGGGLYRSKAISEVKYLAHRWLPAYEEFELAARLRASNWKLLRLADAAVTHEGHEESDLSMLKRLWKNGRAKSGGMLLRSALFKPWIFSTLRKQAYIFIAPVFYLIVFFLAFYFLDSFLLSIASTAFSSIFLLLFMVYRKKDFQSAVYAFVTWHFFFISSLVGFFSEIRNPAEEISSRVLR